MEDIPIVIPSYRRADRVTTHKIVSNAILCVEESEEAVYRKNYPDMAIVTHPDSVRGYCATAQWILDRWKTVFILNDDLMHMHRLCYNEVRKSVMTAPEAYDRIQASYRTAKEMGAHLFGFSNTCNPVSYFEGKFFRYTGFAIGGWIGIIDGGGLRFPVEEGLVGADDYFLSLYNAHRNRYMFVDGRFSFATKTKVFTARGGMAEFRTEDTERRDFEKLQALFGSDVVVPKNKSNLRTKHLSKYEKTIRMPF